MIIEEIKDIQAYNAGMQKSVLDKIWFLNKIDDSITTVYDYGCADGFLLKTIGTILPDMLLCGYDKSKEMVKIASENVPTAYISETPINITKSAVLNASSVFHEIHSYSEDVEQEYRYIFGTDATYIAIRDMFYSEKMRHQTDKRQLARVIQNQPKEKIAEFEAFNGSIEDSKNFLHYLLKYRYESNWDREVRENYFPHSIEDFLRKIPKTYEIVHFDFYVLPFLRDKIKQDFGFTLYDNTHAKILLKRK